MANEINVFELTNTALRELSTKKGVKESVAKRKTKKLRKESVRATKRTSKIACNRLKVESVHFMEDADSSDFDFTPDDEVVLVVDPEMDEVPATEEEAEAAAEELIGDTVCKCSVCGANYVCDCNKTVEEDVDGEVEVCAENDVCPVCGEEAPQIVVGEITPAEDVADDETVADDEFVADETEEEMTDNTEEEMTDESVRHAVRRPVRRESVKRIARRPVTKKRVRTESKSVKRPVAKRPMRTESKIAHKTVRRPMRAESTVRRPVAKRPVRAESTMRRKPMAKRPMAKRPMRAESAVRRPMTKRPMGRMSVKELDEAKLNRLFTSFAKENYANVSSVRFTKGTVSGTKLTVEGVVRTIKGSTRKIKLVSENFKPVAGKTLKLQCKEVGPFTESAKLAKNRVPFVVECAVRGNKITPVSMKYAYNTKNSGLKESKGKSAMYSVSGIVK